MELWKYHVYVGNDYVSTLNAPSLIPEKTQQHLSISTFRISTL